jgi:hypothetical protein
MLVGPSLTLNKNLAYGNNLIVVIGGTFVQVLRIEAKVFNSHAAITK